MSVDTNIAARQAADAVHSLALDEAARFTGEACVRFWQRLFEHISATLPEQLQPKRVVEPPVVPMTDAESQAFGSVMVGFGKYQGVRLDEVPYEYLLWLDEQNNFAYELRRYMASRRIQAEQDD